MALEARRIGPDDLFLVNSTSGTTGLPKCVMHTQNRWLYFHQQAVRSGRLDADDVVFSAVPAPFGFGLWTAHFTPAMLGAPLVVAEQFDPDRTLALIEAHRVTMLAAVSTQFVMMLNAPSLQARDLSTLRVMFTGGEAVPYSAPTRSNEKPGAPCCSSSDRTRPASSPGRPWRIRGTGASAPQENASTTCRCVSTATGATSPRVDAGNPPAGVRQRASVTWTMTRPTGNCSRTTAGC